MGGPKFSGGSEKSNSGWRNWEFSLEEVAFSRGLGGMEDTLLAGKVAR
jgi:hypothetical protein